MRRGPLLVGKISTSGKNISAAKRLVKKTVLCVDNVKNTCSVNDMIAFIKSLSVNVLTCFEVKPRRRANEIDVSVFQTGKLSASAYVLTIVIGC